MPLDEAERQAAMLVDGAPAHYKTSKGGVTYDARLGEEIPDIGRFGGGTAVNMQENLKKTAQFREKLGENTIGRNAYDTRGRF